jgi:hypothetical protein
MGGALGLANLEFLSTLPAVSAQEATLIPLDRAFLFQGKRRQGQSIRPANACGYESLNDLRRFPQ